MLENPVISAEFDVGSDFVINRRPVKGLYTGPPYFKHFFPTVVTYIWCSGMNLPESTTVTT